MNFAEKEYWMDPFRSSDGGRKARRFEKADDLYEKLIRPDIDTYYITPAKSGFATMKSAIDRLPIGNKVAFNLVTFNVDFAFKIGGHRLKVTITARSRKANRTQLSRIMDELSLLISSATDKEAFLENNFGAQCFAGEVGDEHRMECAFNALALFKLRSVQPRGVKRKM